MTHVLVRRHLRLGRPVRQHFAFFNRKADKELSRDVFLGLDRRSKELKELPENQERLESTKNLLDDHKAYLDSLQGKRTLRRIDALRMMTSEVRGNK